MISKVSINFKPSFSFIFGWIMLLCIAFSTQSMGQGQGTQVQFGQNRVQYHDFEWQYYDTDNCKICDYGSRRAGVKARRTTKL